MAQKDLTQKNLETYPDVFADIVNALYYGGKTVVRENELQAAPTESFYHATSNCLKNQFQDVSMYLIRGGRIKLRYMLENQVKTERRMVLRKAGYEGAIYRRQTEEKMVYPIVGAVLYWGKGHWRSPRSLWELMKDSAEEHAVKAIEGHIDNFHLDVFEMAHLSPNVRERFTSDMRIVVDYLAEGKNYMPGNRVIRHPEAFLRMLFALTGDVRYENLVIEVEGKEEVRMCELLDKYENIGMQKGIRKGERKGERKGIRKGKEKTLIDNIIALTETMSLSVEKAMDALRVPEDKRDYYEEKIRKFRNNPCLFR